MITPIRGRKRNKCQALQYFVLRLEMITPIRGRKLLFDLTGLGFPVKIRNDNPDKGTETTTYLSCRVGRYYRLEMITPIRGRKLEELKKKRQLAIMD